MDSREGDSLVDDVKGVDEGEGEEEKGEGEVGEVLETVDRVMVPEDWVVVTWKPDELLEGCGAGVEEVGLSKICRGEETINMFLHMYMHIE